MLTNDTTLVSDGGGKALAARRVLETPDIIAKFFVNITRRAEASGNRFEHRTAWYNGAPGLLIYENEKLITVINIIVS